MNSGPTLSRVLSSAALVAGTALFSVGLQAFAFTQPTAPPPGANAWAPLTTSSLGQTKLGGLTLGTGLTVTQEALHVTNGRIQVGATVGSVPSTVGLALFGKSLMIVDGTQGAGKVLVSDASGKATWSASDFSSKVKVGLAVNPADGSGNTHTITFATPFADTNYVIASVNLVNKNGGDSKDCNNLNLLSLQDNANYKQPGSFMFKTGDDCREYLYDYVVIHQ